MKKISALLIVVAGTIIASFIVFSPPNGRQTGIFAEFLGDGADSNLNFRSGSTASYEALNSPSPLSNQDANLTDKLGQAYAQAIISLNPDSLSSGSSLEEIKVPSQESANALLQEQLSQGLKFKSFQKGDLRVSGKTGAADQLSYFDALNKLSEKNFGSLRTNFIEMLDEWALKQNNRPLEDYLSRIPRQINDLLSLTVPSNLADFHLQNLNLWQKKLAVFTALVDMNEDPLKTYLAIQELPSIVEENLTLQDFAEERYETLQG